MTDSRTVAAQIRMRLPSLTPLEAKVADNVLARKSLDVKMSLKEVADGSGVSEAMVVKVAKKLGFSGFRGFRQGLIDYYQDETAGLYSEISADDSSTEIVQKVFRASMQASEETFAILDVAVFDRAADLLHCARQRDFYGVGGSAQIARDVAHKFLRIGIRASVYDDTHMMAMSANLLGPGDLAIAFSHSGRSSGLVDAVQFAKNNGASIIAVSNYDTGPIAELSDVVLCSTARGSPLTGENAAARIAQLNIMDAVFIAVAQKGYAQAESNLSRTMAAVHTKRK